MKKPRSLPLLLVLMLTMLVFSTATIVEANNATEFRTLHSTVKIFVVIYARSFIDVDRIEKDLKRLEHEYIYLPFIVKIRFNITVVKAPIHIVDKLAAWFSWNYLSMKKPWWVLQYENATHRKLVVKWLDLAKTYYFLYNLTKSIAMKFNTMFNDMIAIVGDVDNVSRQYIHVENDPELGPIALKGVRCWGSVEPFYFCDLTVVAKPRPVGWRHPLNGIPTTFKYEPPIWDIKDVSKYVAKLVRDHVFFHLIGEPILRPWYARTVVVDVYVVDFGNEMVVNEILRRIDVDYLRKLVESYALKTNIDIKIYRIPCSILDLCNLITSMIKDGVIPMNYNTVDKAIASYLRKIYDYEPIKSGIYVVYVYRYFILATPLPSYFYEEVTIRPGEVIVMNFSAYSNLIYRYGVSSYPGYNGSLYKTSLCRVIAHELGHAFGLNHPFEFGILIRWLMDWIASVMSYENNVVAGFFGKYIDYYARYRLALAYTLLFLNYVEKNFYDLLPVVKHRVDEILDLFSKGRFIEAFNEVHSLNTALTDLYRAIHTAHRPHANFVIVK